MRPAVQLKAVASARDDGGAARRAALAASDRPGTVGRVVPASPRVRAEAARCAVDLAAVTGTGAGGRISLKDVRAAAGLRPGGTAPRAEAPARRLPVQVASQFSPQRQVMLDVYGPNPVVEDARLLGLAGSGAAPTLFSDGELPPFTSSGVDPRELRKVPWYARHALAAAPSAGIVLGALEHFAHDPADLFGEYQHWGTEDYVNRVRAWLDGFGAS